MLFFFVRKASISLVPAAICCSSVNLWVLVKLTKRQFWKAVFIIRPSCCSDCCFCSGRLVDHGGKLNNLFASRLKTGDGGPEWLKLVEGEKNDLKINSSLGTSQFHHKSKLKYLSVGCFGWRNADCKVVLIDSAAVWGSHRMTARMMGSQLCFLFPQRLNPLLFTFNLFPLQETPSRRYGAKRARSRLTCGAPRSSPSRRVMARYGTRLQNVMWLFRAPVGGEI